MGLDKLLDTEDEQLDQLDTDISHTKLPSSLVSKIDSESLLLTVLPSPTGGSSPPRAATILLYRAIKAALVLGNPGKRSSCLLESVGSSGSSEFVVEVPGLPGKVLRGFVRCLRVSPVGLRVILVSGVIWGVGSFVWILVCVRLLMS